MKLRTKAANGSKDKSANKKSPKGGKTIRDPNLKKKLPKNNNKMMMINNDMNGEVEKVCLTTRARLTY
jgi:hypothetical protein